MYQTVRWILSTASFRPDGVIVSQVLTGTCEEECGQQSIAGKLQSAG